MRYLHIVVIHHRAQVVRCEAVRLDDDKVILRRGVEVGDAAQGIVGADNTFGRHGEADDVRLTRGHARARLFQWIIAVMPVVQVGAVLRLRGGPRRLYLFGRLKSIVRLACRNKLLGHLVVAGKPLRLEIGAIIAAVFRQQVWRNRPVGRNVQRCQVRPLVIIETERAREAIISASAPGTSRFWSVSSIRSRKSPPKRRASSQENSAVRIAPICK